MSEKTCLTFLNGTGYVFKADDYMRLRRLHRIVGCLVGSTNKRGNAANDCRLPAELTIYETRLLIEMGIAQLKTKKQSLLKTPTPEELAAYKEKTAKNLMEQAELSKNEKLQNTELNIEKILQGKRKKLQKAGAIEEAQNLTASQVLAEMHENFIFEAGNALIEIHCAHPEPHAAGIIELPTFSSHDELKYRIFFDLWRRGKFVTPGDTFGADFLVYPGDPLIYHATHIIIVLDKPPIIKLLYLVTKVRLAVIVNKICVLAYIDEEHEDIINYQTIEWDGNIEQEKTFQTAVSVNDDIS